jgi:hypothetical protein
MLALAACGHTPWKDQADVVVDAIARFVERCRERPPGTESRLRAVKRP